MPEECLQVTEKFMRNPVKILVQREELTLAGIQQFYVDCERQEYKYETLCDLYGSLDITQSVIFCNTKVSPTYLIKQISKSNLPFVAPIREL